MATFVLKVEDTGEDQIQVEYDLTPDISEAESPEEITPAQLAGVAIMRLLLDFMFPQEGEFSLEEQAYEAAAQDENFG